MAATLINIPDFNFSGIYYPEILEDLTQYTRVNCPEITDEDEKEPFEQLKRAFSLVGHLSNVLLDSVAVEEFIATCQLRSSLASHLALIDVRLAQAKPASADLLLELSQVLTATTEVVPAKSQFATEETNDSPAIAFENLTAISSSRTDRAAAVLAYDQTTQGYTDHTAEAITPAGNFTPGWGVAVQAGDMLYVGHPDILWDTLKLVLAGGATGLTTLVWEYFDGEYEQGQPDSVVNNGATLTLTVNGLLGAVNRAGTILRVRSAASGGFEDLVAAWDGSANKVTTSAFLGQTAPSLAAKDYIIGSAWREVEDLTDATTGLSTAGDHDVTFGLPQTITANWRTTTVNGVEAYWLRARLVAVAGGATAPSITQVRIDSGRQYILFTSTQGVSQEDAPLGSSTGLPDQQFQLAQAPVLDDANLRVFVTESTEQPWTRVDDFLASGLLDKVFRVEFDDAGECTVIFGDGKNGKIPAAGTGNIRVEYRTMDELDGNVGQNAITVNKGAVAFLNSITNPRAASGYKLREGSTPEDIERLRIAGPATLRTKGRAVTADDVEETAQQFQGADGTKPVVRARAFEEAFGPKTVELVTVGAGGVGLSTGQLVEVAAYYNGDPAAKVKGVLVMNQQLTANNFTPRVVDVTATVFGGNLAAIKTALTTLLHPLAVDSNGDFVWDFGGEVPQSRINAEIFATLPKPRKVTITTPGAAGVVLGPRELPVVGTLTITVLP
jgi:hypothetical protein